MAKQDSKELACSFCGKKQNWVHKLIAGPGVYICNYCVELCSEIISEDASGADNSALALKGELPRPREIFDFLNRFVIGQDEAKKALSVAVYNHYKRVRALDEGRQIDMSLTKSNILLLGPTGCGKTHLARCLAKMLDVPFVIVDATALTEAGYVGEDVENILLRLINEANGNIARASKGIIYIDEIDKIARKGASASITRDVSGEGVQQALLKIIEGTVASVPPEPGRKHPHQEYLEINTQSILFIVAGAFAGIEDIVKARLGKNATGFGADVRSKEELGDLYRQVTTEDLHRFGMIPEFIGRLPVIASVHELSEADLVRVLQEPENSLIKQYQHLFELDGIALHFTRGAIEAIAAQTLERGTGARALSGILEKCLQEAMFEAPSMRDINSVTITKSVITDGAAAQYASAPQLKTA